MSFLLVVCLAAAASIIGIGVPHLQARLERWAYERHAQD